MTAARRALVQWVATRVAVAVLGYTAAWTVADRTAANPPAFLALWRHWDAGLFVKIARWGYFGRPEHYADRGVTAFFPGQPMLLRAVHVVTQDWVLAGLLVSFVAGAFAVVALARLGALDGGRAVADRTVLYLLLSPFAVFLFVGYSEALFLAFAVPSWLAARRGSWRSAGLLAAGAAAVRVTGLFLAVALLVEYAVRHRRPERDLAWLVAPFAVLAGYLGWLWARTGDWLAWPHAQDAGWGRHLTTPWRALVDTWHAAGDPRQGGAYSWSFKAEIVAVAVGLLLTVALLVLHRWAEATYVGLQVVALATSSFYLSVGRATLLWWPLWLLLARVSVRRPWVHVAYLSVAPALMAAYVVTFVSGHWVG